MMDVTLFKVEPRRIEPPTSAVQRYHYVRFRSPPFKNSCK
jgi:hypothetical protein